MANIELELRRAHSSGGHSPAAQVAVGTERHNDDAAKEAAKESAGDRSTICMASEAGKSAQVVMVVVVVCDRSKALRQHTRGRVWASVERCGGGAGGQ